MTKAPNIKEKPKKKRNNISDRKFTSVKTASFDTLIKALLTKSEKAQCTFIYRYLMSASGEVLAIVNKYSEEEIRKRVKASLIKK